MGIGGAGPLIVAVGVECAPTFILPLPRRYPVRKKQPPRDEPQSPSAKKPSSALRHTRCRGGAGGEMFVSRKSSTSLLTRRHTRGPVWLHWFPSSGNARPRSRCRQEPAAHACVGVSVYVNQHTHPHPTMVWCAGESPGSSLSTAVPFGSCAPCLE